MRGIYNNVYYTLIGNNIVKRKYTLQKVQAHGIINNVGKYENIIKECDTN